MRYEKKMKSVTKLHQMNDSIKLGIAAIDEFEKFPITAPSRIEWHRVKEVKQSLASL